MHAQEKQPGEQPGDRRRATAEPQEHAEIPAFGPMTPSAVADLQRSVGNRVVARMLAEGQHADPQVQRGLVDAALRSPSQPIEQSTRRKLEFFHQTDLSPVRLHTGPLAQRSAEAIGASAYTVGRDIVLGPGANNEQTLGHETRHFKQQLAGRVAGTDNGAGLSVSDPGNPEEREATADGAALERGEDHAPSLAADGDGGSHASSAAPSVQRMAKDDKHDEDYDSDDEMEDVQDKPQKQARKTQKALLNEVKEEVDKHTLAHGGGRHGRVTKDSVRLRFARDKERERSMQTLSHLSMLLHDTIRAVQDELMAANPDTVKLDDREVQGMLINDRLFFASNFNESIDRLKIKFGNNLTSLRRMLETQSADRSGAGPKGPDLAEYAGRLERADTKVNAAFDNARQTNNDHTAEAMRSAMNLPVRIKEADAPDIHELLTDPQHAGTVTLLRYGGADRKGKSGGVTPRSMHAEQKLLLAIAKAGLKPEEATKPLAISGKYRPCVGCAAALRYYKEIGGFTNLEHNPNHGHYYLDSVKGLERHIRHVVEDPHYVEYLNEMLNPQHGNAVSTAALSGLAPPANATFNNGPEIRIPPDEAGGRGYVTASDSDMEVTEQGGLKQYRRKKRKGLPYQPGVGGRRLGAGQQTVVNPGRAATQVLTDADEKRLRGAKTPEEQTRLFREYANRKQLPASQAEIAKRAGVTPELVNRYVTGGTGHKNRTVTSDPKRRTQKKVDDDGLKELGGVINRTKFQALWEAAREKPETERTLRPGQMTRPISEKLADLWGRYSMPSIAKEMRMKETTLRKHLEPFMKAKKQANADVEMADAPSPAPEAPAAMPQYDTDVEQSDSDDEQSEDEPQEFPAFPGYVIQVDAALQPFYVHQGTGQRAFYDFDAQRLRPLVEEQEPAPRAGGASAPRQQSRREPRSPSPEPMDVDPAPVHESSDDEEEEYMPARHGKGVPRRFR